MVQNVSVFKFHGKFWQFFDTELEPNQFASGRKILCFDQTYLILHGEGVSAGPWDNFYCPGEAYWEIFISF